LGDGLVCMAADDACDLGCGKGRTEHFA
jgi:hypothetical protein